MVESSDLGVQRDRQLLQQAQATGPLAALGCCFRLSGPGFLQSAITLGSGSLAGALFLGILGGPSLLWLQLAAILMGVVMLSAISYVTLTTGERPFGLINRHINPVLGWGWLIATCMANIIWCMPQFSLCYEALDLTLVPGGLGDATSMKLAVSFGLLLLAIGVLYFNLKGGLAAKIFDWILKALIGMIVLCFFGVVIYLSSQGVLDWGQILVGFVPDFSQWTQAAGGMQTLLGGLSDHARDFWQQRLVLEQRAVMIGAAATAVGINMTFLMPYSLLQRGWDRTFRGLARFDLGLGMAIPYVLVTSCVVIAAGHAFHGKADDALLSNDPIQFQTSPVFVGSMPDTLLARVRPDLKGTSLAALSEAEQKVAIAEMAALPPEEKQIASSLVRRTAFKLSTALAPLLGADRAKWVFGLGVFGMGFSTIIILMLINGFAVSEVVGRSPQGAVFVAGCLLAGAAGALWPMIWDDQAKLWLAILASSFGMMLLPIAYITFFMLLNSSAVMGADLPQGARRWIWNLLMGISVVGALIAAGTALYDKVTNTGSTTAELAGKVVLGMGAIYFCLVLVGFKWREKPA
ncbi:MAG: divalent metal cation transporter [Pirellulales bacterium]|nr:divalent metal cation transporter [Pirellulales bacterium]